MSAANLGLQGPDRRAHKLDDPATMRADQVVVGQPWVNMFVEEAALSEMMLANQTRLHEKLQIAIDRGSRDPDAAARQRREHRLRIDVTVLREDLLAHRQSLGGHPQTLAADEFSELVKLAGWIHGGGLT